MPDLKMPDSTNEPSRQYFFYGDTSMIHNPLKPTLNQAQQSASDYRDFKNQRSSHEVYGIYRLSVSFEFQDRDYGYVVQPIIGCFKDKDSSFTARSELEQCQFALDELSIPYSTNREIRRGTVLGVELDIFSADIYQIKIQ